MSRIRARLRLLIQRIRPTIVNAIKFIKLLRVEPYLLMVSFQMGLVGTPNNLLVQDKICTQWYNHVNKTVYCFDLPSTIEDDHIGSHYKTRILTDSSQFGTYNSYAKILPSLIWATFLGAWVDRYVRARKLLMIGSAMGGIAENLIAISLTLNWNTSVYYNLLLNIPKSIVGGTAGYNIAVIHYLTSTTPPKLVAIRFMIFQVCHHIAFPIGQSLGGYILVQKPAFYTGEIRNFTLCYIIALVFEVIALIWVVFMINERVARKQEMRIEMKIRGMNGKIEKESNKIKLRSDMTKEDKTVHPLKLLFDLTNVKTMLTTITKKRPNNVRKQLILLIISLAIIISEFQGLGAITAQFIERVYLWKPDWISYMSSIDMGFSAICAITFVPFLVKVIKLVDVKIALLGYCINFITNMLRGTWLSPNAYYVAMAIGPFGSASIGTRSLISKLVDRDEMGKVMSFLAILDTVIPVISMTTFAYIFKYTIDSYPGAVYLLIAGFILIPIWVTMWIDLFNEPPLVEGQCNREDLNGNIDQQDGRKHNGKVYYKNPQGHHKKQHNNEENGNSVKIETIATRL